MNIITKLGNILNEPRGILVHSANAMGVMGTGLALQIRRKYPLVYKDYKKLTTVLKANSVGKSVCTQINDDLIIITGIGQNGYGREPRVVYTNYEAIKKIFEFVNQIALTTNLPVIFPLIGCGLGHGDWKIVESIINETLDVKISKTLFIN